MTGDHGEKLTGNLRHSLGLTRELNHELTGTRSTLGGASVSAGLLATEIARASKATAAIAGPIGIAVALLGTAIDFVLGWREKTKQVAQEMAGIARQTSIINAQGNRRLEGEAQITARMEDQLEAAEKLESKFRKFPELQKAIKAQADAARRALVADIARDFEMQQFETRTQTGLTFARMRGERASGLAQAAAERQRAMDEVRLNREGLAPLQRLIRLQDIEDQFEAAKKEVEFNIAKPVGDAIGRSFAGAIADGISTAVRTGNLGAGLRALGGSLLIGLGEILQMLGERTILASALIAKAIAALTSLNPLAGVAAGVGLIAAGSVLKGLGQSMGGRSGGSGGGGGSSGGYAGSSSSTQIIDRGLVNPLNGVVTAPGIITTSAARSFVFAPTIIGPMDAAANRQLVRAVREGLSAEGRSI